MKRGMYHPIRIVQGETIDIPFDIQEDGVFLDPSILTIEGVISNSQNQVLATFTIEVDEDDLNISHAKIDSDTTSDFPVDVHLYELRITQDDEVKTVLYGPVEVSTSPITAARISNSAPPQDGNMFVPIE